MLSELVWLQGFGQDRLAAMSIEELERCLANAKREIIDFEESERRRERFDEENHCITHVNSSARICYMAKFFYGTELELRERRALNEDRLTLIKELRKVKRERGYDRKRFPDTREVVLSELLAGKGGHSLVDRRYSRALDEESKALDEELERERLLREETHSRRSEEPRGE
jgi:hypothetical protein